jgi:hypothetical protein
MCLKGGERLFLCTNDRRGFIRLTRDLYARLDDVAERGREVAGVKKRQGLRAHRPRASTPRLAPDIIQAGADQAVAGNQPVIQERERFVGSKRRQPQRETRDLHRGWIEIDAEETSLSDLAPEHYAVRRGHIGSVPSSVTNQRLLGRFGKLYTRSYEERAAAHRWIQNPQPQDVLRRAIRDEWRQGLADQIRCH